MVKRLMIIMGAMLVALWSAAPAADGWDLVSSQYGAVGVYSYSAPVFCDIDNDNDPDLFVGDYNGRISFFRNDGSASAPAYGLADTAYNRILVRGGYARPAFADLDGDGDQDMLTGCYYGTIYFYRNTGTAAAPVWVTADSNYNSIDAGYNSAPVLADLDGDSDFDLLVGGSTGLLAYYRNDGTALSPQWTTVSTAYNAIDVGEYSVPTLCDVDHDNDPDLFVGRYSGYLSFYRNDGTALSPAWTLLDSQYFAIDIGSYSSPALADIDGDNDPDLLLGESAGNINLYRNQGTPQAQYFTLAANYYGMVGGRTYYSTPAFCDIDADGDQDLFIGAADGSIRFYGNSGNAATPAWRLAVDTYGGIVAGTNANPAFADIDGDGDQDLFIGKEDGQISFYRNTGSAATAAWTLDTARFAGIDVGTSAAPALCDIDGDGDLDLFTGDYYGYLRSWRNIGTRLSPAWLADTAGYGGIDVGYNSRPAFCDIDRDGDQDLFLGNGNGSAFFYYNTGTALAPTWVLASQTVGGISVGSNASPAFCDLDGDNDQDLFVGEYDGSLNVYRNSSAAAALYWGQITGGGLASIDVGYNSTPCLGDLDGDGDLDLLAGDSYGYLHFYRNTGTAAAPVWTADTAGYGMFDAGYRSVPCLADIDGDNDLDLLIGKEDGQLSFYRNDGTALAAAWTLINNFYYSIDAGSNSVPCLADLDGDHDLDLLIGNSSGYLYFYRNRGTRTSPYWALESSYYGSIDVGSYSYPTCGDVDGDGDLDLLIGDSYSALDLYENTGSDTAPTFTYKSGSYLSSTSTYLAPFFGDVDADGKPDLLVGTYEGYLQRWEALNMMTGMAPRYTQATRPAGVGNICSPNPMSSRTVFAVPAGATGTNARIVLRNSRGQLVRELAAGQLEWDGCNLYGQRVKPGIYLYQIKVNGAMLTGKVVKTGR
jgi:hypothetical protein